MKLHFFSLILFINITAFSQNVELIGGLNKNNFFDLQQNAGHFISSYNSDYGYAIRIGIEDIKVNWLTLRFTLGYDNYCGKLTASGGGLGSGFTTNARINKSIISLAVFPINFKIIEKIDLNFGFELAKLISEKFKGTYSGWAYGEPHWNFNLNDIYNKYSSKTFFGLRGRIAYDFNISDKLVISPQYSYYLGLSHEFDEFPEATKSMRQYFCIGLQRKIK